MGYWTKTKATYGIKDYAKHPWAELVRKTLGTAEPELLESLTADGELDAYIDCKLDDAVKLVREQINAGTDYATAKEVALADMFPVDPPDIEEYEQEGGQQDAIDAFTEWVKRGSST